MVNRKGRYAAGDARILRGKDFYRVGCVKPTRALVIYDKSLDAAAIIRSF